MPKDDSVYLDHIREMCGKIAERTAQASRDQYDADETLRLALAHLVQTIGEAASRVSIPFRDANPHIPWQRIIGMRNRIVHDYMHVDADILWEVVTRNVPELLRLLDTGPTKA